MRRCEMPTISLLPGLYRGRRKRACSAPAPARNCVFFPYRTRRTPSLGRTNGIPRSRIVMR
jgi:hypothetical protein